MKHILLLLWCAALLGMIAVCGMKKQAMEMPPETTAAQTVSEETAASEPAAPAVNHREAGAAAARSMMAALGAKRITEGTIGILGVHGEEEEALQREAGFREAFAGSGYTLLQTRYDSANPSVARSIAWQMLSQGAVGLYGCGPEGTAGASDAAKQANSGAVITGFGISDAILKGLQEGPLRMSAATEGDVRKYEPVPVTAAAAEGGGFLLLESELPLLKAEDLKIALIASSRLGRDAAGLEGGAAEAAAELGCQIVQLSPLLPNEAQQIQGIETALSSGCFAIIATADVTEGMAAALARAAEAGVAVVSANPSGWAEADVTVSLDHRAAGRKAGEAMLQELTAREIPEGDIGIIQVSADAPEGSQREAGFREAFEGSAYQLLQTQYSGGDAAQAHELAQAYIRQRAVGIFCCSEGDTIGAGNGAKAAGSAVVIAGFGSSAAVSGLKEAGHLQYADGSDAHGLGYEAVKAACAFLIGECP